VFESGSILIIVKRCLFDTMYIGSAPREEGRKGGDDDDEDITTCC